MNTITRLLTDNEEKLVDELMLAMIRKDSYTFVPDRFPREYTEEQKAKHYQEQRHLFIVEALNTPYEKVTEEMKNTWHNLGLRMAMPSTGIGRSMQDDMKKYRDARVLREQAAKAQNLNQTVSEWWGRTRTFIKTFSRV